PVVQPELARTLETIREAGSAGFYTGDVADACIAALNGRGGRFTRDDWRGPAGWTTPLAVPFFGTNIYTQPPPSRGLVLAKALREYARQAPDAPSPVAALRALGNAFTAVNTYAGDPDITGFDAKDVLNRPANAPCASSRGGGGDSTYSHP